MEIKFNIFSEIPEVNPFFILNNIALLILICPSQSAITGIIKLFK